MPGYWDFRSILDVYPDKGSSKVICVAIIKGKRCGQSRLFFSKNDLYDASRILDTLDSLEKLSSSRGYLEDLAELTLCPRWHKNDYAQVQCVTRRWQRAITEYAAEVEEEEDRAAKVKSRVLAEKKRTAVNKKVKSEEDADKVSFAKPITTELKRGSVVSAKVEITKPSVSDTHMPKISLTNIALPPSLDPDLREMSKLTSLQCSMPSPPASPVVSITATSNGIKLEQCQPETPTKPLQNASPQQTFKIAMTSNIKSTATAVSNKVAPKTISHDMTKIENFNFECPPTPDATPESRKNSESTSNLACEFRVGKQVPIPTFNLEFAATLSTPLPVADLSTVSRVDNVGFQSKDARKLNSNTEYKIPSTSFDFSTSLKLPSFEADPFFSNSVGTPKPSAHILTNLGLVAPEATPEPAQQNCHDQEESYGYAIVTPSWTRYKSYLPSQQRYGLQTPPDTPETINNGCKDSFLAFISDSQSSAIEELRKPLSAPSTLLDDVSGKCEACVVEEGQCDCDEDLGNERVGCFHSLRLRKLRKSVSRKTNAVKTRLSGVMHRMSDTP